MSGGEQGSVRGFFDSGEYLRRNPIIPVRARLVRGLAGELRNARVLDLGCGDGAVSRPLSGLGNRLTLVDFSAQMLEHARAGTPAGASVEFVQSDVLEYVPADSYDLVLCIGLLAHVPSVDGLVQLVSGALRPSGRAILQITDDRSLLGSVLNRYYRWTNAAPYSLNVMSRDELIETAHRHGLDTLALRRYGLLLPGLGRLPAPWEAGVEMAVATRPRLAKLGSELLASFQKRAG
jgi:SAM-dependent methyltransferase